MTVAYGTVNGKIELFDQWLGQWKHLRQLLGRWKLIWQWLEWWSHWLQKHGKLLVKKKDRSQIIMKYFLLSKIFLCVLEFWNFSKYTSDSQVPLRFLDNWANQVISLCMQISPWFVLANQRLLCVNSNFWYLLVVF